MSKENSKPAGNKWKWQHQLPNSYKPNEAIQEILMDAGVECNAFSGELHKLGYEPICPLDLADYRLQKLLRPKNNNGS